MLLIMVKQRTYLLGLLVHAIMLRTISSPFYGKGKW